MEKGCIILRDRHRKEKRYPLFEAEIGEVVLKSGNMISTGVLSALGFWGFISSWESQKVKRYEQIFEDMRSIFMNK